jgi:hypothetical protein
MLGRRSCWRRRGNQFVRLCRAPPPARRLLGSRLGGGFGSSPGFSAGFEAGFAAGVRPLALHLETRAKAPEPQQGSLQDRQNDRAY